MEIQQRVDDFTINIKKNLKSILMDLAVAFVSVAYVLYQLLTLEPTDLNPIVLIGQAIVGIVAGILIKMGLGENGFIRGYQSLKWATSLKNYNSKCNIALPYIDYSTEYREQEIAEKLKRFRKTRLSNHRMKYDDWFDEKGDFVEHEIMFKSYYDKRKKKYPDFQLAEGTMILTRKQKRVLFKCVAIKVYPLDLFNEYDANNEDDTKKEVTDKDVRAMNLRKNTIWAVAIALLGVYFVPSWKWDLGHFLWACMQVSIWVTFGVLQLYSNYQYITIDKTNLLARKERGIIKFCKKYMPNDEFLKSGLLKPDEIEIEMKKLKMDQPKEIEQKQDFIEVEMTEEEMKAKGLIK